MRRTAAPAAVLLLLLLGGCTATPSADAGASDAAIGAWIGDRTREAADDSLGTATARTDPALDDEQPDDAGITLTYDQPVSLTGVRLSCTGATALDVRVHVTSAVGQVTTEYPGVACGDPVEQPVAAQDVTEVRVDASGGDRAGAWHAVLLGRTG